MWLRIDNHWNVNWPNWTGYKISKNWDIREKKVNDELKSPRLRQQQVAGKEKKRIGWEI